MHCAIYARCLVSPRSIICFSHWAEEERDRAESKPFILHATRTLSLSLSLSLSLLPAQRKFISTHDRSRLRPADFLSKLNRWVVKFHPITLIYLSRASGLRQRLFFAGQNLNRNLPSRRNNLLRTESRALQEDEICGTCLDTF